MRHTFAITLVIAAQAVVAAAQTPSTIRLDPYAGTVTDDSGSPVAGAVNLTFELYEEQDGGAPLWSEDQRVNTDDRDAISCTWAVGSEMPAGIASVKSALAGSRSRSRARARAGDAGGRALRTARGGCRNARRAASVCLRAQQVGWATRNRCRPGGSGRRRWNRCRGTTREVGLARLSQ